MATMQAEAQQSGSAMRSVRAVGWLNFFLADVQTGVGPFLAAYLSANHWNPRDAGLALTLGSLVGVLLGPFAGAVVDVSQRKRAIVGYASLALAIGAVTISLGTRVSMIAGAQVLIGGAGAFLPPTVAAITLGIVGARGFDRQFGKNQSFNSAGNVFTAALMAAVTWVFGMRSLFITAALLAVPVWLILTRIDPAAIDNDVARGEGGQEEEGHWQKVCSICSDRALLFFLISCFLFHLANAAMLPLLGEMLAKGNARAATPFMSACVIVTQIVIACTAAGIGTLAGKGRKPLLLLGFGVLPLRGLLYAVTHATVALIAIQVLDGLANAIFTVVAVLVVADRTRGTGHFNLAQGVLATCVGLGASLGNAYGGELAHRFGFSASFLGLAAVAVLGVAVLALGVPETRDATSAPSAS